MFVPHMSWWIISPLCLLQDGFGCLPACGRIIWPGELFESPKSVPPALPLSMMWVDDEASSEGANVGLNKYYTQLRELMRTSPGWGCHLENKDCTAHAL